jgi:glucose dehydrogenase
MRSLILIAFVAPIALAASGQHVNWLSYGNDLANTRFQPVDQINPANVARRRIRRLGDFSYGIFKYYGVHHACPSRNRRKPASGD